MDLKYQNAERSSEKPEISFFQTTFFSYSNLIPSPV